jgi:hypothetical protein
MKVDCSITENYINEKARMTESCTGCNTCPLALNSNDRHISCRVYEAAYADKAIAIVQEWSDEHPIKTYKEDFFEKFPNLSNVNIDDDGYPIYMPEAFYGYSGFDSSKSKRERWDMVMGNGKWLK